MPTPPACLTARLLSTRVLPPRAQSTTFPATLTGSRLAPLKHWVTWVGLAPGSPAPAESISAERGADGATPIPLKVCVVSLASVEKLRPSPSVTFLVNDRSWVPAATVVSHGIALSMVAAPAPALPAAAATNTPAAAALRNASSVGPNWSTSSPIE